MTATRVATDDQAQLRTLRRLRSRVTGFTLIELMIVMAVAMLVIGFAVAWYQAESKRKARAELIEVQAIEMATLARALEQYLDNTSGLPESGGFDVSTADIEAAGYLPYLYLRPTEGLPPVSPLGQVYVLRGIRHGDHYRGIVLPTGVPSEALLARYGIKGSADDLFAYATKVMRRMGAAHYATAGVIRAGTASAHPASGFSADFTSLLEAPAAYNAVAGLAGFREHSPFKDLIASVEAGEGPDGEGSAVEGRVCRLVYGECGNDEDAVWLHRMCEEWPSSGAQPKEDRSAVSLGSERISIARVIDLNTRLDHNIGLPGQYMTGNYFYPNNAWLGGGG